MAAGVGGWTKDGKAVLLYDKFDIWSAPLDGGIEDGLIGAVERGTKGAAGPVAATEALPGRIEASLHGHARCDLAAAVAAQPVGHGEDQTLFRSRGRLGDRDLLGRRDERRLTVECNPAETVFIVVSDVADRGHARVLDGEGGCHDLHLSGDGTDVVRGMVPTFGWEETAPTGSLSRRGLDPLAAM